MKRSITFLWGIVAITTSCLSGVNASELPLFGGSPVSLTFPSGSRSLDVDGDGAVDFSFRTEGTICTTDIPASFCSQAYVVIAGEVGRFLLTPMANSNVTILDQGEVIGETAPEESDWSEPEDTRVYTSYVTVQERTEPSGIYTARSYWTGPLAEVRVGYVGIRVASEDGDHFGWVKVALPPAVVGGGGFGGSGSPTVVDFAIDPRPNVAIAAGDKPRVGEARMVMEPARPLRLRWEARTSRAYLIQWKASLTATEWVTLETVTTSGTSGEVDLPTTGGSGFYRIVEAQSEAPSE